MKILTPLVLLALVPSASAMAQQPYFTQQTAEMDWITLPAAVYEEPVKGGQSSFATPNKVDLTAENSGMLSEFDDGLVTWVVGIASEWSVSMNAILSDVELGIGDVIYAYSPDGKSVYEYTYKDNKRNRYMQILPIEGDSLVIEYQSLSGNVPQFTIETVNCAFMSIDNPNTHSSTLKAVGFGTSSSCEVNATCYANVEELMNASCRLIFDGKTYGSGNLIANTAEDSKPYVLTSAHMFDKTFSTCYADFGYNSPNCQSDIFYNSRQRIVGAEVMVFIEQRDVALLLLDDTPPESVMPYWVGWNVNSTVSGEVKCLHHPSGDVCKISVGEEPVQSTFTTETANGNSYSPNAHWRVPTWTVGATEGGSSGSGLYNEDGQLVGCLTGGESSCSWLKNDYFWQLCSGWDATDTIHNTTLSEYLDPTGSGATEMDGAYAQTTLHTAIYNIGTDESVVSEAVSDGWGYVAGNSSYGVTVLAERFDAGDSTMVIDGVYLAALQWQSNVETLYIGIWDEVDGVPGNNLYTYAFNLSSGTLSANGQDLFSFGTQLELSGVFYVGLLVQNESDESDLCAYYYSKMAENNTARFRVGKTTWVDYNELTGSSDVNCSLFIGLKALYESGGTPIATIPSAESKIRLRFTGNVATVSADTLERIRLYDLSGSLLLDKDARNLSVSSIDMGIYPSGMYFVRVTSTSESRTFKILNNK